jgi:hypothetical protein
MAIVPVAAGGGSLEKEEASSGAAGAREGTNDDAAVEAGKDAAGAGLPDFTLDPYAGGTFAFYESVTVVQSPASSVRKWTRYDVVYTLPRGPERTASTFHGSIGRALAEVEAGVRICVWTEQRGSYLNIVKLAVVEDEDDEGEGF